MADDKKSLAQSFFATGIDAYIEQCRHGGVKLETAGVLTDREVYAFPPTPRDQDSYGNFASSADFHARVIASRLRTSDNRAVFARASDKDEAIKTLMGNRISSIAVTNLAEEILRAYGELEAKTEESDGADDEAEPAPPAPHHTPGVEAALGN